MTALASWAEADVRAGSSSVDLLSFKTTYEDGPTVMGTSRAQRPVPSPGAEDRRVHRDLHEGTDRTMPTPPLTVDRSLH